MPKSVVKVYCLPLMSEESLRKLHQEIVELAIASAFPQVKNENDLITLFPKDAMEYGLGSEILIELDIPGKGSSSRPGPAIAKDFVEKFKVLFPSAFVQCTLYLFDSVDTWSSDELT